MCFPAIVHVHFAPDTQSLLLPALKKPFVNYRHLHLVMTIQFQVRSFESGKGEERFCRLTIALKDFALVNMIQVDPKMPKLFSRVMYPSMQRSC